MVINFFFIDKKKNYCLLFVLKFIFFIIFIELIMVWINKRLFYV